MPIEYETISEDRRTLLLKSDIKFEPELAIAALIHGVVKDLLHSRKYAYAHFDEHVDLATIACGIGALRSSVDLVTKQGRFWDTTQWQAIPRPFLDAQGVAYANSLAAWIRGEKNPAWADDLETDIRRPMAKTLKYLVKTGDSFLQANLDGKQLLNQDQRQWLAMSAQDSVSTQIIALRHLQQDDTLIAQQQQTLSEKLPSSREGVVLSAIVAAEQVVDVGQSATDELQFLTRHRQHVVRARAMCALTRLGRLEEETIQTAGDMLGSKMKHEIFAGLSALSSLGSVDDQLIPPINRAFIRSLQVCDYEFVNLFAAAFTKWLDDPKAHVENLLQEDSPEYLEIAIEAIEGVNDQLVGLS